MRPQDLLNSGLRDQRPAKIQQDRDDSLKVLKKFWKLSYAEKLKKDYVIGNKEVKHLKDMLKEFDLETIKKTMTYFVDNYESLDYFEGFPSLSALYGFRRTLVPETLFGRKKKKSSFMEGQAEESSIKDDDWG